MVPRNASIEPRFDLAAKWQPCTPETARDFSAAGYFFGRELASQLDVPIGLVSAAWGGTRIEAWITPSGLIGSGVPGAKEEAQTLAKFSGPAGREALRVAMNAWWQGLDAISINKSPLIGTGWDTAGFADAAWRQIQVPSPVDGDLAGMDGLFYFRRTVTIPANWAGKPLVLELGPVDDRDDFRWNGKVIGESYGGDKFATPRRYFVPGELVKAGETQLAIRVLDTAGPGGMLGNPEQYTLKLEGSAESISLAGPWRVAPGAKLDALPPIPTDPINNQNTASALSSGMLSPLTGLTPKGVIWYQGESNISRADTYQQLQDAFITDLAARFNNPNLSFFCVQIAPYHYGGFDGAAHLRQAQEAMTFRKPSIKDPAAVSSPRGVAITLDNGNAGDIHPDNKQEVGRRLAIQALQKTYGKSAVVADGPRPAAFTFNGATASVSFEPGSGTIRLEDDGRGMFELAGEDQVFWPATARVTPSGDGLTITSPSVSVPKAVRYAWTDSPFATLFGASGLPASGFRSDDWTAVKRAETAATGYLATEPGFEPLLVGADLSKWNTATGDPRGWTAADGILTGRPEAIGCLLTEAMYDNYTLELEWSLAGDDAAGGILIHADALPAAGSPLPRGLRIGAGIGNRTSAGIGQGDIEPLGGAALAAVAGYIRGDPSVRAWPSTYRAIPPQLNSSGAASRVRLWNHFRIDCDADTVTVALNGAVVSKAERLATQRGHIALLPGSGAAAMYRNIRIKPLKTLVPVGAAQTAAPRADWQTLYNGTNLSKWKAEKAHEGHFVPTGWRLVFDGKGEDLWSAAEYKDFELMLDWRWTGKGEPTDLPVILADGSQPNDEAGKPKLQRVIDAGDSGVYVRGSSKSQVNIWCWPVGSGEVYGYRTDGSQPAAVRAGVTPKSNADKPIGQWNRFIIRVQGSKISVNLNGTQVLDGAELPGMNPTGPIALQKHDGAIEFANIFIRELK